MVSDQVSVLEKGKVIINAGCVCTKVGSENFSVLVWKTVFSTLSK